MSILEIYSDFNCTWCYFDKPVIKKIEKIYDVKIRYRAFPLHPDIPEGGMPIQELFGYNKALMTDKMYQLEKLAASLDLPLAKRAMISDSRLAQELAKWAESEGKLAEYQDSVYSAYFSEGLDIAEISVLTEITKSCGFSKKETLDALDETTFSEAVDADWEKSDALGIMVAPTYMMNGTKLMGSQSYTKLEELMITNKIPIRVRS
jgi:predicted DsbA family dithiol-disulfide isomerase